MVRFMFWSVCWVDLCQLNKLEERIPIENVPPGYWAVGKLLRYFINQ